MENINDLESFSLIEAPSSPVPKRKLKRLKKAESFLANTPNFKTLDFHKSNIPDFEEEKLETLDLVKSTSQDLEESSSGYRPPSKRFENENGLDYSVDSFSNQEDVSGAKRTLDFGFVAEEFNGGAEDRLDVMETEKENEDLTVGESKKKRHSSDVFGEKKNERKRVDRIGDCEKPKSDVVSKRRTNKDREQRLKQLRAESQRLLRETRDAAFKSVPLVQKPISSVLEKIRQRKLEASKKSVKLSKTSFLDDDEYNDDDDDDDDDLLRVIVVNADSENAQSEDKGDEKTVKVASKEAISCTANLKSSLGVLFADVPNDKAHPSSHEIITTQMAVHEEPKQTFRPPVDDTQDLFPDSQASGSKDQILDETPNSPLEEVLAPSFLAMNLKLDSAPPHDVSSDEEANDKENIDPCLQKLDDLSSSPNSDPVKAFVDDEAEEEDDSDNDLFRFQDNEEDDDTEDVEELKDMIATEYKEKPIDTERRNELHQKWLEQQDAAGTEKLLQRFKCGSKQIETSFLEEEEEEESEEDNEFGDEATEEDIAPTNVRMNLRKLKEMIPQMFTDKDDAYISSDDEETKKSIAKQCLSDKSQEQATFLSPAEDKDSKEVFSLIKKLNIVPDSRKRKTSALSEMQLIGGNRTVCSKSSFLARGSKHSLPLPKKRHGSSMVRSFIFERDDSNSTSTNSVLEGSSDMVQTENRSTKTAPTRLYNSQIKSTTQNTKAAAQTNSGIALFEILRRSSLQSTKCTQDSLVSHTESVLATFRLEKPIKKEPNMSIRTL